MKIVLDSDLGAGAYCEPWLEDVSEYPRFPYAPNQLKKAGEILAGSMPFDENNPELFEKYKDVFRVAYSWRNLHIYPMRRVHHELSGRRRADNKAGISFARAKRMASIRAKLARSTTKLNQIQDLGGCRAVLHNLADYHALVDDYRNGCSKHSIRSSADYVAKPKPSGYRGHHFVLRFQADVNEHAFADLPIEVQMRTALQHSWATAVEAVGDLRGEDLKAGLGNADWLRLFALVSSEFAVQEDCPIVPGTSESSHERREEIRELNAKISALFVLENISSVARQVPIYKNNAKLFLIKLDSKEKRISVEPIKSPMEAAEDYSKFEELSPHIITVLTEADKITDLALAFPNYFGNVRFFCDQIKEILTPAREHR